MKNIKLLPSFLLALTGILFFSCEQEDNLGPMDFKYAGLGDTAIIRGSVIERNFTIYFLGGEREKVTLTATGVPNGTTVTFSPSTVDDGVECLQRITASATADTGTFPITVAGTTEKGAKIYRTFQLRVSRPQNNPPRIILNGATSYSLTLNNTYTEPGYSAIDTEDGDISSQVSVTGTVNKDSVGIYILTYTVSDSEGLSYSINRSVNVRNSLNYLSGQYDVNTSDPANGTILRNWITAISASVSVNNRIVIFKISDCYLADPFADYDSASNTFSLPSQTFNCITPTDTLNHTFTGTGSIIQASPRKIRIDYSDSYTDPSLGTPVTLQRRDEYTLF